MKVTSKIKGILKEKDKGIKNGMEAMQEIMKNLHGQIMNDLGEAAIGSWDAYYLRKLLDSTEKHIAEYEDRAKKELSGQLDIMWDKGGELVKSTLIAGEMYVDFGISRSSLDVLKDYSNDYLEKLFGDAWYQIKGEINLGILGAKTPQEVAQAIGTEIDKGRFANIALRAETITQTEMGRIFSEAAQARMEEASGYVEGLEKQWIHAGHPRQPRPAHLAANGQHVPIEEPFVVGGIRMMFPRDPNAPISEVINCGCDHVPYHERWK